MNNGNGNVETGKRKMEQGVRFHFPFSGFRFSLLKRGNVMIVTLLILLTIMLGFAFIGSVSLRNESEGVLMSLEERQAQSAASACMETAIDRLGRDENYAGDESIDLGGGITCTIRPVIAGATWTIESEAQVSDAIARYRVVLTSRIPVEIDTWSEIDSF
jgi:hypothetical protein